MVVLESLSPLVIAKVSKLRLLELLNVALCTDVVFVESDVGLAYYILRLKLSSLCVTWLLPCGPHFKL